MLGLSTLPGLPGSGSLLTAQRVLEVGALAPNSAQAGAFILDAAIDVLLTTQAGLLLTLPSCLHWGAQLWDLAGGESLLRHLGAELSLHDQSQWVVAMPLGLQALGVVQVAERGLWVVEAGDWGLGLVEITAVAWSVGLVGCLGAARVRASVGYDDLVTLCQQRGLSIAEIASLTTLSLGLVAFDMFVTLAEDDVLEAVSYVFGCIIGLAVLLLVIAVDLQYYYMVSAVSGGEATLRLLYSDFVNNALCLLRVFFCWIRYLFYDLQAELVDFAFHYTEFAEEEGLEDLCGRYVSNDFGASLGWLWLSSLAGGALGVFWDAATTLVQLLIGGFKLALALFLFWLILDLFLLRTAARAEALGLARLRDRTR